jgi:hypothetical protein
MEARPNRRSVRLDVGNLGGVNLGKYEFEFAGASVYFGANSNMFDSAECTAALRGLSSVAVASCTRETSNALTGAGSYIITLQSYPSTPHFNNLIYHNGNPVNALFRCNTSLIDDEEANMPYCTVSDVLPVDNIAVYSECSNHGTCDRVFGKCQCDIGFKGETCSDTRDADDIQRYSHVGPFFTGTLLKTEVLRDASAQFNLFQARISGRNVTTIRGDSELVHSGAVVVREGPLVVYGPQSSRALGSFQDVADTSLGLVDEHGRVVHAIDSMLRARIHEDIRTAVAARNAAAEAVLVAQRGLITADASSIYTQEYLNNRTTEADIAQSVLNEALKSLEEVVTRPLANVRNI